jgi:plasmid maintenance system antidote protein VapI
MNDLIFIDALDQTTEKQKREDLHRLLFSFGYVLWEILGGRDIDLDEAAARLQVSPDTLRIIIQGKQGVSQQEIKDKNWREIFVRYYPETWSFHELSFNQYAAFLKKHPAKVREYKNLKPEDEKSFGYLLWLIIGGEDADINDAAQCLRIFPGTLDALLHGKKGISQQGIASRQWRTILAGHYPDAWRRYAVDFEKHVAALPTYGKIKSQNLEDDGSFGFVLWLILGGENADIPEAAKRLKVHYSAITKAIYGLWKPSQQIMKDKRWRETFAEYYPETWRQYESLFEERSAPSVRTPCVSEDKKSFGYAVWLIIGGNRANIQEAAKRLKVDRSELSKIVCGRKQPSQNTVDEKQWRQTFAEHYPDAWRQYENLFEKSFATLTDRQLKPHEPEDKESFGYILWLIIGGKNAQKNKAAEQLKIDSGSLRAIIYGRGNPSQELVKERQWRKILAEHYPDAWEQYETLFEERAATLAKCPYASEKPTRNAKALAKERRADRCEF